MGLLLSLRSIQAPLPSKNSSKHIFSFAKKKFKLFSPPAPHDATQPTLSKPLALPNTRHPSKHGVTLRIKSKTRRLEKSTVLGNKRKNQVFAEQESYNLPVNALQRERLQGW